VIWPNNATAKCWRAAQFQAFINFTTFIAARFIRRTCFVKFSNNDKLNETLHREEVEMQH